MPIVDFCYTRKRDELKKNTPNLWWDDLKPIESIEDFPDGTYGFVYRITNVNKNKIYIGRKNLFSVRKKKLTKKQLTNRDKRLKDYTVVTKESNWKTYTGSCKELNEDIKNGDEIIREILCYARNKAELTYFETKWQFILEVLENNSYNDNINGKFYRRIFDAP